MKLENDKKQHILMSAIITLMFAANFSILWGVIIGSAAGLFKEFVYDLWMKKGVFDKMDLVFNFVGVGIGLLIALLTKFITIYC